MFLRLKNPPRVLILVALALILALPIQAKATGTYMSTIQRKIKRSWFPPRDDIRNGEKRSVVVRFDVHKDGSISNLRLHKSSGQVDFDKSGLDAVLKSCPFEVLPEGAPDPVQIEFQFDWETKLHLPLPNATLERQHHQCIVRSWFVSFDSPNEP